ncbi:hypothetical protein ACR9H8_18315 [Kosakonia cowanii]
MRTQISTLKDFFGPAIEQVQGRKIRKDIMDNFRLPYIKKDMNSHGPLWSQYACPQGVITVCDIKLHENISGYIFAECKSKEVFIYNSTLIDFIKYLESREGGLFPAVYFIKNTLAFCLCESGERGTMKPIYLYKASNI